MCPGRELETLPSLRSDSTEIVPPSRRYYGIKLAAHYMTLDSTEVGKSQPGGKIVVTSSGTGLFPMPAIPQYSASKHALVGLVRSLGRAKATLDAGVRINAVCPAIVATPAIPQLLLDRLPADQITPMGTIIECFDACADLANAQQPEWVQSGPSGETVEGNVAKLIWHQPPIPPGAENAKFDRANATTFVADAFKSKVLSAVNVEE
jgi:15-hydroxyprostaglandin dehydrogenase (NAD)